MADQPTTSLPIPGENLEYSPISPWAIAGLAISTGFALVVVGSFLFAAMKATPYFLPDWIVFVPLAGGVISFVGMRQVALSEGTRVGTSLARWGIWLAVFSGVGYGAFYYFTVLALAQQANHFLLYKDEDNKEVIPDSGFFPRLLEAGMDRVEFNRAFFLTQMPSFRAGNPADDKEMAINFDVGTDLRGKLSQFRDHFLVKMLAGADPKAVRIEPLGVQKWDFAPGSYTMIRNYRISTPEATVEASLTLRTQEGEGERRKWSLVLAQTQKKSEQLTKLGETLKMLRGGIYATVEKWQRSLDGKVAVEDVTDWEKILPDATHRRFVRGAIDAMFYKNRVLRVLVIPPHQVTHTPWKREDGKIQMEYPLQITLALGPPTPSFMVDGIVRVESNGPVDLEDPKTPSWRVLNLEWRRATQQEVPGGPPPHGRSPGP